MAKEIINLICPCLFYLCMLIDFCGCTTAFHTAPPCRLQGWIHFNQL